MECVAEKGVELIIKLLPYAWRAVKKFIWLNEEIGKTLNGLRDLQLYVSDIDDKLIEEGRKPLQKVGDWEKEVKKTEENVDMLVDEFQRNFKCEKQNECVGRCRNFWHGEKINRHKFGSVERNGWFGLIPYFWHRCRMVRHVYDYKSKIVELGQTYEKFKGSYDGRRFVELLHPGSYAEESFEKEMLQIQKWLKDKGVQVIGLQGVDSDCTASLLKIVYNNDEVREFFNDMVCFMEASYSSLVNVEIARENLGKVIGLPAPVSKDKLYTHLSREKFRFLLLLNDLQDALDLRKLGQMVAEIGLPSLKEKHFKIVFSCKTESVVAAMNVKETSIEVLPREEYSWMAFHKEEEKIPHIVDNFGEFTKSISEPSKVNLRLVAIHLPDVLHMHCFACVLQFCFGLDTILWYILIPWLSVLTSISLVWWWRTRKWEPKISPPRSIKELQRSYSKELKILSTWLSWDRIPQSGDDGSTTSFEMGKQQLGSSSRFQRKSDEKPEPEIVPAEE